MPIDFALNAIAEARVTAVAVDAVITLRVPIAGRVLFAQAHVFSTRVAIVAVLVEIAAPKRVTSGDENEQRQKGQQRQPTHPRAR